MCANARQRWDSFDPEYLGEISQNVSELIKYFFLFWNADSHWNIDNKACWNSLYFELKFQLNSLISKTEMKCL